jgi:hypothetical protein
MLLVIPSTRGMVSMSPSTSNKGLETRLPFNKPLKIITLHYHPLLLPHSITMLRAIHGGRYPHPSIGIIPRQFPIIPMDVSVFYCLVVAYLLVVPTRVEPFLIYVDTMQSFFPFFKVFF